MRILPWALVVMLAGAAHAQEAVPVRVVRDSITVEFADADLRNVVQALSRYLPKPILATNVPAVRVSLQTPTPVSRADLRELVRGLLESQNLELIEEPAFLRIRQRAPAPPVTSPADADARPAAARQQAPGPRLFVIRLRHARAADVAATVNQLFSGAGTFSGSSGAATGTLSDELRRLNVTPGAPAQRPANAPGSPGTEGGLQGAMIVVPDEGTNALLVRATAADFDVIRAAVEELDIRPLQVLIEVLIIEARRDHTFSLGADPFVAPRDGLGGEVSAEITGGGLGDLVVKVLDLGGANVNATLRAAESRGNVTIVSRPVLLASNNAEARLLVGTQRPFVQVSRSLPTDAPSRDQVVQYRDVGTRLTVKPTINHDGYVSLAIQQEVSAATNETQFDAPVIATREATTRVLLRDGQTVVLGGLRDEQRERGQRGVPLLSRIPLFGGLFGSANRQETATEFYLFLTPRILRTDADVDSVTAPRLTGVHER